MMIKKISMEEILGLIKEKYDMESVFFEDINTPCFCFENYNEDCFCYPNEITVLYDDDIRVVICNKCGALDNERCKSSSGRKTKNHAARILDLSTIANMREEKRK